MKIVHQPWRNINSILKHVNLKCSMMNKNYKTIHCNHIPLTEFNKNDCKEPFIKEHCDRIVLDNMKSAYYSYFSCVIILWDLV
jgi:hypothetical protein